MSKDNKQIVSKTKEILKEYGHEVKTGHIYEMYSKLAGDNSWNVASAKKISFFQSVIDKFKKEEPKSIKDLEVLKNSLKRFDLPPEVSHKYSQSYFSLLDNGYFRDKFHLGDMVNSEYYSCNIRDFSHSPNALFIGNVGSGKSVAAAFSALTWMANNADQTMMFIADITRGANDYQSLFNNYDQVYTVLSDEDGVHRVISLIYDELNARRDKFNEIKVKDIHHYERLSKEKISRIVFLIEDLDLVLDRVLNFNKDRKVPLTSAYNLEQILKIGRTLGIWVIATSQRGTKSDIPSEIIQYFSNKLIFRVSKTESAYFLSDLKASEIRSDQKGRCETEFGSIQFPYISLPEQQPFVEKYIKKLTSKCMYLNTSIVKNYLIGKNTSEVYEEIKLENLCRNIEFRNQSLVLKMIKKKENYSFEVIDKGFLLLEKNKEKIVLLDRISELTPKIIDLVANKMRELSVKNGLIYTTSVDISIEILKFARESNITICDKEDLLILSRKLDKLL